MNAPGDIRYARTRDGVDIAYTVFGEGPDLLLLPGFVSHLDHMWDFAMNRALVPLGRRFRVIALDKRGTGLSDRSLGFGSIENRAEDDVHTGEVERRGDRIGGIGVHIAARIMALAGGGEILVSRTVRDLTIGSEVAFEDRGTHELKGVSETWQLFAVT